MSVIDHLFNLCSELSNHGWRELFLAFNMDIQQTSPEALRGELLAERSFPEEALGLPGFEDYMVGGKRGIEPGDPAASLVFHALASPGVRQGPDGSPLTAFPSAQQLDDLENAVYGLEPPDWAEIYQRAEQLNQRFGVSGSPEISLVAFAREYRTGVDSAHRNHADMCYSRTGVARVGTLPPRYLAEERGYWPAPIASETGIHVTPSTWGVYLAILLPSKAQGFGPMRRRNENHPFWVPFHKFFSGEDCIRDLDLNLDFISHHSNRKINKIHAYLNNLGLDSGFGPSEIQNAPFILQEDIARVEGSQIIPFDHAALVAKAETQEGEAVQFQIPPGIPGFIKMFSSSLELRTPSRGRPVPEYVHVRHEMDASGQMINFNDDPHMLDHLQSPQRNALHYKDFTGDGLMTFEISGLPQELVKYPGYSVVAAPNFFPGCDQRELVEWATSRNLDIWEVPPDILSDKRIPPDPVVVSQADDWNQDPALPNMTAIISGPRTAQIANFDGTFSPEKRLTSLPDAAAGFFAPGWDISLDTSQGMEHLAAYGLGSPFPEDAKLCAALSAFWPAAAPDATRTYLLNRPTVAPMTDEEIQGPESWDGLEGPRLDEPSRFVVYPDFDYADYVESALLGRFNLKKTSQIHAAQYTQRAEAAFRARNLVRLVVPNPNVFSLVSFRVIDSRDEEAVLASDETQRPFSNQIFHFKFADVNTRNSIPIEGDHRRRKVSFENLVEIMTDLEHFLARDPEGTWHQVMTT